MRWPSITAQRTATNDTHVKRPMPERRPCVADAVAGAINIASLVHGTVAHGGMTNSETVFLQLATGEGSRYKMLSVIIPIAVWRQIAGTAEPGSFKGKIIEVQTTPQVAGGRYVNMMISAATQFRVVGAR